MYSLRFTAIVRKHGSSICSISYNPKCLCVFSLLTLNYCQNSCDMSDLSKTFAFIITKSKMSQNVFSGTLLSFLEKLQTAKKCYPCLLITDTRKQNQ